MTGPLGTPVTMADVVAPLAAYIDDPDLKMPGVSVLSHRRGKTAVLRVDHTNDREAPAQLEEVLAVKLDGRPSSIHKEEAAYLLLGGAGVPVTDVVAGGDLVWPTTETGSLGYLATRWVHGHPVMDSDPVQAHRQVGQALRLVHQLPAEGWRSPAYQDLAYNAHKGSWLADVLAWWATIRPDRDALEELGRRAREWFDRVRPLIAASYDTLILFDGRPDHFLVDDGELAGIIDVETLWAGDPAMDIAVLQANAPGIYDGVLDGYEPSPTEERRLRQVVPFYAFLRALSGARWALEQAPPALRDEDAGATMLARAHQFLHEHN